MTKTVHEVILETMRKAESRLLHEFGSRIPLPPRPFVKRSISDDEAHLADALRYKFSFSPSDTSDVIDVEHTEVVDAPKQLEAKA